MKPYQFLECPVCGRIVPCMQSVCDCGHRFIGIDGTAEEGSPSGGSPQAAELVYMLEDGDGFLVRVPQSKLSEWEAAQSRPPAPLTKAERRLSEKIMERIYGPQEKKKEEQD